MRGRPVMSIDCALIQTIGTRNSGVPILTLGSPVLLPPKRSIGSKLHRRKLCTFLRTTKHARM